MVSTSGILMVIVWQMVFMESFEMVDGVTILDKLSLNRPLTFASRGLTKSEKNYPAHKLEFLAMKWAICDKFKDYLFFMESVEMVDGVTNLDKLSASVLFFPGLYAISKSKAPKAANHICPVASRLGNRTLDQICQNRNQTKERDITNKSTLPTI
jgi:hypothetical protein